MYILIYRFPLATGKHLVQAQPLVYTLQCLAGKRDNDDDIVCMDMRGFA